MQELYDGEVGSELFNELRKRADGLKFSSRKACDVERLDEVAKELRIDRRKLRRLGRKLSSVSRFDLRLVHDGLSVPIASIVTTGDFGRACAVAVRAYSGTLKNLELPGYMLTDGKHYAHLESLVGLKR